MSIPDLVKAFNAQFGTEKTRTQIHSTLKNHKITCGRKTGTLNKGKSKLFTLEQMKFLEASYMNMPTAVLAPAFNERFSTNIKESQVRAFVKNHGIKSERTGRFTPEHKSWNKGTKGLTGRNPSTYKKGDIPKNIQPIGHERIDTQGGFILVKIEEKNPFTGALTRYKHKHVWLWEQANGPIPDGFAIVFRDSNPMNCIIENLMLLQKRELLALNLHGYKAFPQELKPSVLLLAKLEAKAGIRTQPAHGRKKAVAV